MDAGAHRGMLLGVVAALAAVALLAILPRETSAPPVATSVAPGAVPAPVAPVDPVVPGWAPTLAPVVTLVSGTVMRDGDAEVSLGDTLAAGASLSTAEKSEVDVRLASGTGLSLAAEGFVTLTRVQEGSVRLDLGQGTVSLAVAPLGEGDTFVVGFDAYTVHVKGTRFAVTGLRRQLQVDLTEGRVEVRRGDEVLTTLEAPAAWRSNRDPQLRREVVKPAGLDPDLSALGTLELPRPTGVMSWTLEGRTLEAAGTLAMRLPPGPITATARGAFGQAQPITVEVAGGPAVSSPTEADLSQVSSALARVFEGHLSPEAIRPVVAAARPGLRRCYERAMRGNPEARVGRMTARVRVGRSGAVTRVTLEASSGAPPGDLQACVEGEIKKRAFPRPQGGPVTFEVPLSFRTR